ncbi:hypothetical protein O181_107134 [Austropuccinia psidii MF-1]|uniref:Uncharacterized protein n=1 Tax=Austropuccinia psidii MF-1 TaxID=1389203 RepID=A0A9Q3JSK7_9BASI|nr:hypothetical protein [Austropuccinia psidii MF-1]
MELCTCRSCSLLTCTQPHGPVPCQFISSCNKRKHEKNDLINSQNTLSLLPRQMILYAPNPSPDDLTNDAATDSNTKTENEEAESVVDSETSLPVLIGLFICWLNLFCALSWQNCWLVYKFIEEIISASKIDNISRHQRMKDLRTMKKSLLLHPELDAFVCCPMCFSMYTGLDVPMNCTYKSLGGNSCNANLFKARTNFSAIRDKGIAPRQSSEIQMNELSVINNPIRIYYTHGIRKWTEWLLKIENIEDKMDEWNEKIIRTRGTMDIQQGLAWKSLSWSPLNANDVKPLQLVFSILVDWFNPWGNKISGKQQSLGLILLNCLNLPPQLRNKPSFSLLYAIIPGPNAPNIITISNCLKLLVDELLVLKDGFEAFTAQNPCGRKIYIQVLPIRGDLLAVHKVVGFGSPAASQFCGWCQANLKELTLMKIGLKRTGLDVLDAAKSWLVLKTLKEQEEIQRRTGVRWSELNRLPYRIPNMHVALGVMHNWLEGALAEHF